MKKQNTKSKEDPLRLFKFVRIHAGKFLMGSPRDEKGRYSDEDRIEVEITQPFEMLETAVTQLQYFSIMEINPSSYEGMQKPVQNVSWEDCQTFIKKLNEIDPQFRHIYRLPTEAEWEYCCRAGSYSPYWEPIEQFAHFNSSDGPVNVKSKRPNDFGLYDMHGNVWEWCSDWYQKKLKGGKDPQGPDIGSLRVFRGGSWSSRARDLRSASRGDAAPGGRDGGLGFRLVRTPVSLGSPTLVPSESETRESVVEAILKKIDLIKIEIEKLR